MSPPPLAAPRRQDRIYITGATDSGKTHLARRLFAASRPPRIVVDPKDDVDATGGVYADQRQAVTFHDPAKIPAVEVSRFVPRDPDDLDAYDRLLAGIMVLPSMVTWLDEAGVIMPASGSPDAGRRLINMGRSRGHGVIALHQRPVDVYRGIIGNAETVVTFVLYHPDDRDHLARFAGLPPKVVEAEMGRLSRHGFLWYSRAVNVLASFPPLDR